jgi:hypothetical protein
MEMLKTTESVREYLKSVSDDAFDESYRNPTAIVQLTTGIANAVHRLIFDTPSGSEPLRSVILKHSTPYVFTLDGQKVTWDLWPYENMALRGVPTTDVVKVPKLLWVDEKIRVTIIEDAGIQSLTLKDLLLREDLPATEVLATIGDELGKFAAKLHWWGCDETLLKKFENPVAKQICSWRTFGRIERVLKQLQPDMSPQKLARLQQISEREMAMINNDNEMVIMGDFWPGNTLINLTEDGQLQSVYLIDWELIRGGDSAMELSQMSAEVWEAGQFGKNSRAVEASKELIKAMCKAYKAGLNDNFGDQMMSEVMIQAGAHVAVWVNAGYSKYGDEKKVGQIRQKGLDMFWKGAGETNQTAEEWGFEVFDRVEHAVKQ